MKTINELIKSYLENEDKAVFGEILDVIRTGDSLFAVAARVTNNFFMGAENAKPAAYIFSSKAFADEFVKELKWKGYEVKSLEIRAAPGAFQKKGGETDAGHDVFRDISCKVSASVRKPE